MQTKFARSYWFTRCAVVTGAVTLGSVAARATGSVDPDVQSAIDGLTASWSAIKTAALVILGLMLAIGLLKKGYRKLT